MEVGLVPRLDALRPAIKTRWTALLRADPVLAAPATPALVTREMLAYMLDDTLARLSASLLASAKPDRRPLTLDGLGSKGAGCACGIYLLWSYYLAGAQALKEKLPAVFGPARVVVLDRFNRLAHDEMVALCGVCRERCGRECGFRPKPPSRRRTISATALAPSLRLPGSDPPPVAEGVDCKK